MHIPHRSHQQPSISCILRPYTLGSCSDIHITLRCYPLDSGFLNHMLCSVYVCGMFCLASYSGHAYGFLVTLKTSPQKPSPMCLLLIRCHCLTGRKLGSSLCTYSMDSGLWKHQWGHLEGGERWKRGKGRIIRVWEEGRKRPY